MKILVTGAAGFIGYHLCNKLVETGHVVVGLDNLNDFYSPKLKADRLASLGFSDSLENTSSKVKKSSIHTNLSFVRASLEDASAINTIFKNENFDIVCNLAAQAGVRYSLENPAVYAQSNVVGFLNILEGCRNYGVKHLVYASSSSVYGLNKDIPFKISDSVDTPISLYAATKRSNELMAHTYSHLFNMATTGLRFFTVYGPWGRPDMALFLFVDAILNGKEIKVFNHGKMERDFTYVNDIVGGIMKVIENKNCNRSLEKDLFKLYNIGNNQSVKLMDFIEAIEKELGVVAKKKMLPLQPGDVEKTWADVNHLIDDYGYRPDTNISTGVKEFITWYKTYYGIE